MKELIELLDKNDLENKERQEITELSINYILNMSVGEFREAYFGSNNTVAFNDKEISLRNLITKLFNSTENTYPALLNPDIFHSLRQERDQTKKVGDFLLGKSITIPTLQTSEVLNKINEIKHRPLLEEETKARESISEKQLNDRQFLLDMKRGKSIDVKHGKSDREFQKNQLEKQERFKQQLKQDPLSIIPVIQLAKLKPVEKQKSIVDPKEKLKARREEQRKKKPLGH